MDTQFLDDLAKKFSEALPPGLKAMKADLEKAFKAALSSVFSKMDLVTREELEVQAKILARARVKLKDLEAQLAAIQEKPKAKSKPAKTDKGGATKKSKSQAKPKAPKGKSK